MNRSNLEFRTRRRQFSLYRLQTLIEKKLCTVAQEVVHTTLNGSMVSPRGLDSMQGGKMSKTQHPSNLQLPPSFHRLQHRNLIGIFDVAPDGNAHSDARHLHARALQLL